MTIRLWMPKGQAMIAKTKPLAANDVASRLRDGIRMGRYVPGQRLVEADIIADTGATRSRVREALQRLATEGLVTIEEFRGASVKKLTLDEVRQIYRARMALEGLAAAEFATADKPDLKARLQAIQTEMDSGESTGDHEQFGRLNTAWHRLIIEGAGNDYVRAFLATLTVPIYRLLFSTFYNAQRIDAANADHRLITAAIVEGRAEDAERFMRAHVEQGFHSLSTIHSHFGN
ncbi:bacterial regulatory protein, gntR family protein [Asticcacaulis biprosthecium C19]|uniref:Bacterial regulatory protein, gntR family protein n=2 Tax=Asticcacaulis biprosthecium TaxID=76891 RepID=F4QTI6_9CAUL|nr:bacterial regulatory protein, gntR family protein [Asticcacaulis biprosthecium C19]